MKKFLIALLGLLLIAVLSYTIFNLTRDEQDNSVSVAEVFYSVCCVDGTSNDCQSFNDMRYTCIPGGECVDRGPNSQACPADRPVLIASGTTCTPEDTYWSEWSTCTQLDETTCARVRNCQGEASCGGTDVCGGQPTQTELCDPSLCGILPDAQEAEEEEVIDDIVETNNAPSCNVGEVLDGGVCKVVAGECGTCDSNTLCSDGLSCTNNGVCERSNVSSNCFAVRNYK